MTPISEYIFLPGIPAAASAARIPDALKSLVISPGTGSPASPRASFPKGKRDGRAGNNFPPHAPSREARACPHPSASGSYRRPCPRACRRARPPPIPDRAKSSFPDRKAGRRRAARSGSADPPPAPSCWRNRTRRPCRPSRKRWRRGPFCPRRRLFPRERPPRSFQNRPRSPLRSPARIPPRGQAPPDRARTKCVRRDPGSARPA